ncbi:ribosomal protein L3 [Paenibacillus sp. RC84]
MGVETGANLVYTKQNHYIGITPVKRFQLGGVIAKEKHSASPKLTGSARYRGTKVDWTPQTSGQFGWHRENIKALLVP